MHDVAVSGKPISPHVTPKLNIRLLDVLTEDHMASQKRVSRNIVGFLNMPPT